MMLFVKFARSDFQKLEKVFSRFLIYVYKLKSPPTSANNNKQQILTFVLSNDTIEDSSFTCVSSGLAVEKSSKHQKTLNLFSK